MTTHIKEDTAPAKTGVLNNNVPMWLHEEIYDAIDPGYEAYLEDNPDDEYGDEYYNDDPVYLVGFIKIDGLYEPDESADYSAIISQIYTQVVKSKWVSRCAYCSPCFPDQGDLGTDGDILAYTLSPDVWGDVDHLNIVEV